MLAKGKSKVIVFIAALVVPMIGILVSSALIQQQGDGFGMVLYLWLGSFSNIGVALLALALYTLPLRITGIAAALSLVVTIASAILFVYGTLIEMPRAVAYGSRMDVPHDVQVSKCRQFLLIRDEQLCIVKADYARLDKLKEAARTFTVGDCLDPGNGLIDEAFQGSSILCLYEVAKEQHLVQACERMDPLTQDEQYRKDFCFVGVALAKENISICAGVKDFLRRGECVRNIQPQPTTYDWCEFFNDNLNAKQDCLLSTATVIKDRKTCFENTRGLPHYEAMCEGIK